ncbi:hypothetical protein B0A55_00529 [Friedmanniomyces simplex]|uniref:Impact N-terminal domain-containing protein n=1 Tax=Friedmanniomyces simplex TaxID=329884 RepID=A0A4U0Y7A6_9PEZI|nr:hypothetical protein B0A55_00529 [Friedmanniomyces simplex]
MSQKRKRTPDLPSDTAKDVYCSEAIDDRQSKFIAYYSPTLPAKQLQNLAQIKSASHKILAWRKESKQRSLTGNAAQYDIGHDDDGEKYGGKRVEKVLEQMRVTGACVVARWYGGVMLGPLRFTHMEECAKGAVMKWREHEAEEVGKRRRVEEEGLQRGRLARTLGERDGSIEVLRAMAMEKEGKVREALVAGMADLDGESKDDGAAEAALTPSSPSTTAVVSPQRAAPEYSSMPIDRLRALDKARDATIAFLLKRISKAEADLAALGETQRPP